MKIPAQCKPELCASKDATRATLQNLLLKNGTIIATDGRMIVRIPVEVEPGDVDGLIPVAVLTEARQNTKAPKSDTPRRHRHRHDPPIPKPTFSCAISATSTDLGFRSRFGAVKIPRNVVDKFVNTDGVMSAEVKRKKYAITLNPKLLLAIAQAMGSSAVTISFDNDISPITVEPCSLSAGGPLARGILMPVRTS